MITVSKAQLGDKQHQKQLNQQLSILAQQQ